MTQAKYRQKEFSKDAVYHVYNRGVGRGKIFNDYNDYIYYIKKLKWFKEKYRVEILAYCLIYNHYHILLKQITDQPFNKFMGALNTSYGGYFNKKYKRVGPLMQDRYKQAIISGRNELLWMSVYVNCNYEIHGYGLAESYEYSSYQDYLSLRDGTLCSKNEVLKYFESIKEYKEFSREMIIEYQEDKINKR